MAVVEVQDDGIVAELVLNRPDNRNAVDLELSTALRLATEQLQSCDPKVILLRSSGVDFCVGGDLRFLAAEKKSLASLITEMARSTHEAIQNLEDLDLPIVTAVGGAIAGGGLGLALCGDLIVAGESSRFRAAYSAIGLSPDCGVSHRLPRRIGESRAAEMTLMNKTIDAQTAERWGLVNEIVPDSELYSTARQLAEDLAESNWKAIQATRSLIKVASRLSLEEQLKCEVSMLSELADTPWVKEQIASFVDQHGRNPRH